MSYYDRDRATAARTMNIPKAHHGNTAEFLVSGWPFLETHTTTGAGNGTSTFGFVTQWVCISAIGANVTVTLDGGAAAFTVPAGTISPRFDFKCTSVKVALDGAGSACVSAGLTNVRSEDFPDISTYTGVA